MAYVPEHEADVFISYSHDDDFAWVERFVQDLETRLRSKLRARTRASIFFDDRSLRAGRVFDADIPAALDKTGFFLAFVSRRYNSSTYCKQKELRRFVQRNPPETGRLIQMLLDLGVTLPVEKSLAIAFADKTGLLRAGSSEYEDALRRIYEPVVTELDRLYAASKIVFLAWPSEPGLQDERERLRLELEGRGFRIYPEEVTDVEGEARLRAALTESTTSVHLFGAEADAFDLAQWDMAVRLGKPCVAASGSATETRRGPAGSPAPVYMQQGNPITAIAKAVEQIFGVGKRDERAAEEALGRTPVFLVYEASADATLGLKLRKRIKSRGPFDVIVPPNDPQTRYEDLTRAKLALVCRAKAGREWLERELDELNRAISVSELFDLPRVLLVPPNDGVGLDAEEIIHSEDALDAFLMKSQGAAA